MKSNNVKSLVDDYYMIKEVLTRRLKKIQQDAETILPDVIIIDGGRGHFNVAKKIIKENKLDSIYLISVSKGKNVMLEEKLFIQKIKIYH